MGKTLQKPAPDIESRCFNERLGKLFQVWRGELRRQFPFEPGCASTIQERAA
jgi:hypothetical protein